MLDRVIEKLRDWFAVGSTDDVAFSESVVAVKAPCEGFEDPLNPFGAVCISQLYD